MTHRIKKDSDGWSVREAWDAKTGQRHNAYFFKRKRAQRFEIKGKLAQQLAAYTLIEKDLRNVLVWLGEIEKLHPADSRQHGVHASQDRETFNVVKGLYVAALTFYGKCFTSCEGRRVKLDRKILGESYQSAHDDVMHMRHNFAAHSGADSFEEVRIAVVFHPKNTDQYRIYRELTQPDFADSAEDKISFAKLAEHVQEKVWEKIRKVEEALRQREIHSKGTDYWRNKCRRG